MALLEVGGKAPDFTLSNQDKNDISLSDFGGQKVLLWFVPRAFGSN